LPQLPKCLAKVSGVFPFQPFLSLFPEVKSESLSHQFSGFIELSRTTVDSAGPTHFPAPNLGSAIMWKLPFFAPLAIFRSDGACQVRTYFVPSRRRLFSLLLPHQSSDSTAVMDACFFGTPPASALPLPRGKLRTQPPHLTAPFSPKKDWPLRPPPRHPSAGSSPSIFPL